MSTKNIAILFGGCSPEYSVSLESASGVIKHLDRERFTPVMVGITKSGEWFHFNGDAERIADDTWQSDKSCTPAMLSTNRRKHELLLLKKDGLEAVELDAVFPVMHGKNGEDGTVQGLCELAGIPLVGCGTLASALAMDKDRAHKLAGVAGVTIPRSFVLEAGFEKDGFDKAEELGFPVFIKPVRAGSSYGITKASRYGELQGAVKSAFLYDSRVIVEECIPGFEVGCAVMGNAELITGEIDEIELSDGFFDFREKYNLITSKIHVPARISREKSDELKETARTIYRALGCEGFARVDMFLKPDGGIVFNEVNTIPGFTPHSRFPSMMQAAGMSFPEVVSHAVSLALER